MPVVINRSTQDAVKNKPVKNAQKKPVRKGQKKGASSNDESQQKIVMISLCVVIVLALAVIYYLNPRGGGETNSSGSSKISVLKGPAGAGASNGGILPGGNGGGVPRPVGPSGGAVPNRSNSPLSPESDAGRGQTEGIQ